LSRRRPNSAESSRSNAKTKPQKVAETNGYQSHHSHPLSRDGTPIPKRSYKFEECSSKDAAATPNGILEKEKSNTLRQERSIDRATENSMRIEKRMQELLQIKRQSSKN